jgi:hypothetical protein
MPGVFPDYPAPVMRNTDHGSELTTMRWGMPPPPKFGGPSVTNIRNTSSPYWRGWLELAFVQVLGGLLGLVLVEQRHDLAHHDLDGSRPLSRILQIMVRMCASLPGPSACPKRQDQE